MSGPYSNVLWIFSINMHVWGMCLEHVMLVGCWVVTLCKDIT
jgi:hypothetical protein